MDKEKEKADAARPIPADAFEALCTLANELETMAGRGALVDAATNQTPFRQRAEWAIRRGGLDAIAAWLEQVTAKETGKAFACKTLRLLLAMPADLRAIRRSGAAKLLAHRYATHPLAEVRRARAKAVATVARRDARRAEKSAAANLSAAANPPRARTTTTRRTTRWRLARRRNARATPCENARRIRRSALDRGRWTR